MEIKIGSGTIIATTLRLEGGLGDQAQRLEDNIAGQHLFKAMTDYLNTLDS